MQGFAAHKLAILVKLAGYILELDKSFSRGPPAKVMYVVPTQVGLNTTAESIGSAEGDEEGNEFSGMDDSPLECDEQPRQPQHQQQKYRHLSSTSRSPSMPPPPPQSSTRSSVTSSVGEWPQTDFIKRHILDGKLKSAARIVPSPNSSSKGTSGGGSSGRATSVPRGGSGSGSGRHSSSRSATPSSTRKGRRDDPDGSATADIDAYDLEERAAALEAIQALRAARNQGNSHSRVNALSVATSTTPGTTAPVSTYNAEPPILSSTPAADGTATLSELAAAEVNGAFSHPLASSVGTPRNLDPTRETSKRAAVGFSNNSEIGAGSGNQGGGGWNSTGGGFPTGEPTGEFAAYLQRAVDAAVSEKLASDPMVQQVSDAILRW